MALAATVNVASARAPLLAAALSYAARGWAVFPCWWPLPNGRCACGIAQCDRIGKHPLGRAAPHGLIDATTDAAKISAWWAEWPLANVAVATGQESGLVVLDVDAKHDGDEALAELEAEHGALPESVGALTGGGGTHSYFRHPLTGKVSSVNGLRAGVDRKADGGYVVAPPSRHASGREYAWNVLLHPDEVPLAACPQWLRELRGAAPIVNGHATAAIGPVIADGQRNQELTSLAGTMRRRGMDPDEIEAALLAVNRRCKPPLTAGEVRGIARSVGRYEPAERTGDATIATAPPAPTELEAVGFSGERLLRLLGRPMPPPVEPARPVPGHFATLVAPPMIGKSTLAFWNAMARAAGVAPWPGAEARDAGRVLIYSLDEAPEQVARRMNGLATFHPAGRLTNYAANLVVIGPDRDIEPNALDGLRFDERGLATLTRWLTEAAERGAPFAEVYVDAYADVMPLGESENSNEEATRIGGALERLAVRFGCAIVLLHHTGKPKPDQPKDELADVRFLGRGASALAAKARAVMALEAVVGMPHLRRVRTATNLGPSPRPALFQVCAEDSQAEELLFFRPATAASLRDPSEFLASGESISTNDLARLLARDSLADGAEPSGELKVMARQLRDAWQAAGKVTVKSGKNRSKVIALVESEEGEK